MEIDITFFCTYAFSALVLVALIIGPISAMVISLYFKQTIKDIAFS